MSSIQAHDDTCRPKYEFHFICQDPHNKEHFVVMRNFILTHYNPDISNVVGQYVSSLFYQAKNSIEEDIIFYVTCNVFDKSNREKLQRVIDKNIEELYKVCYKVYEFYLSSPYIKTIYDDIYTKYKNDLSKKNSHISKEITIHSKNNDCKLNLYMIINHIYFHKKQYIINNPSFELL